MDSAWLVALMQQTTDTAGNVSGFVNYSISIGDLITLAGSIIGVVGAYARLVSRLDVMGTKIEPMWEDFMRRIRRTRE